MTENKNYIELVNILGEDKVSLDTNLLNAFSKDLSYSEGKRPSCIAWPTKTSEVEKIVKLANLMDFGVIPVSSNKDYRMNGDTVPKVENTVILDLSRMKKVLEIDKKNRVSMIEPGVTFGELIPMLRKNGLKTLIPLLPSHNKSVLTSTLERVPITMPKYQWDSSDPLLCTEVVFGTGDLFRTGTAAGPGTIKQQKKGGQAQANPMGPSQFSAYRVVQGSQGSLGVVTWATIKLEYLPTRQKAFHLQSNNINDLMQIQHELLKYRLCDELVLLNDLNLACLMNEKTDDIIEMKKTLSPWNLIFLISGRGKLADDRISYLEGDILDQIDELSLSNVKKEMVLNETSLIKVLSESTSNPWRLRLRGACNDIFFLTSYQKVQDLISTAKADIPEDLGVYVQGTNQGTSFHCEFNLFHNKEDKDAQANIIEKSGNLSRKLMDAGAFFSRPYTSWTKDVFERYDNDVIEAMKKVKKIFDPKGVLNPGVLCF